MDKVGKEDPGSSAAADSHRAMMRYLVDSLASQLAVLDREGNIILVNEAWKRFARENAAGDLQNYYVGVNQDRDLRYTWINSPVLAWAEQDSMGRTDREIVGGPEAEELMAIKRAVLDSGVRSRKEMGVTFNGEKHYYDLTVEPMRDSS